MTGEQIQRAAWLGTAVFAATSVAAVLLPEAGPVEAVALVDAVGLFLAGCVAFFLAYARAVQRSRSDLIGIGELYFLAGQAAPTNVKRNLLGALAVQVAIAFGSAIARPYSVLAFGALAPVYGLGLCGLWASRFGTFTPRPPPEAGGKHGHRQ